MALCKNSASMGIFLSFLNFRFCPKTERPFLESCLISRTSFQQVSRRWRFSHLDKSAREKADTYNLYIFYRSVKSLRFSLWELTVLIPSCSQNSIPHDSFHHPLLVLRNKLLHYNFLVLKYQKHSHLGLRDILLCYHNLVLSN